MSIHRSITIGAILTSILFFTPNIVMAQETPEPSPEAKPIEVVQTNGEIKLKLNFQDMPLQSVMEYLSETAGLTVLSDEPLSNGRVTVISRQAIPINEAVSLINSILKENGLTTVLTGKTLKVVTLSNAKLEQLPVLSGRDPDAVEASDDVVTYVVPLAHLTAANLLTNLSSMIPEYASITANEDGNALIITDTTANIRRLMQIIKALDTHMSSVTEIRVFPLLYADATSAVTLINNIFSQDQTGTSRNRNRGPGGMFEMMMGGRGGRGGPGGDNNQNAQTSTGVNTQVIAAAQLRQDQGIVPLDAPAAIFQAQVHGSICLDIADTTGPGAGGHYWNKHHCAAR